MWTKDDQVFLRKMRVDTSDPPPPLPRFRVEPCVDEGWYRVIDARRNFALKSEFGPPFEDPRASAEDLAKQLNEQYAEKGTDG